MIRTRRAAERFFVEIMLTHKGSDGSSAEDAPGVTGQDVASRHAAAARFEKSSGIKKPATGFRRGLTSCDAEHMPVICPTCQILFSKNDFAGKARMPAP
jgi:hypothetical protein